MSQSSRQPADDDMLDEYDFSGGVRGKYVDRFANGSNIVLLDPDVAEVFHDARSVNAALRSLIRIAKRASRGAAASD